MAAMTQSLYRPSLSQPSDTGITEVRARRVGNDQVPRLQEERLDILAEVMWAPVVCRQQVTGVGVITLDPKGFPHPTTELTGDEHPHH
jgi:hypothetical protein